MEEERVSSSQNEHSLERTEVLENDQWRPRGEGVKTREPWANFLNVSQWVELKTNRGVIFILHFHYFIFIETANTQKSQVF